LLHRALDLIGHRRITAGLFLAFLLLFCVGLVVPQRPLLDLEVYEAWAAEWPRLASFCEALGFEDVYRSTAMQAVFAVFVLQLLLFLWRQGRRVFRAAARPEVPPPEALPIRVEARGDSEALERLTAALRARRYRVARDSAGGVQASKNRYSGLGSLVFHASFILLSGGAWVLKAWNFHGEVILAEGQPFTGQPAEYLSFGPAGLEDDEMPAVSFMPQEIEPVFGEGGRTVDVEVTVAEPGAGDRLLGRIAVNRPMTVGDAEVLLMGFGLAPAFVVTDGRGRETDAVIANLAVWAPGHPEDSFHLSRPPATVYARFFPDSTTRDARNPSMELRDPMLELRIQRDLDGSEIVGSVRPGESLSLGEHQLEWAELRTWGTFQVSRKHGTLLILGFLLMVLGIAFRFFFVGRKVAAQVCEKDGAPVLSVGGQAEFFPESLRLELEDILAELGANRAP
jgi:Na+-transporting methylmalonyl-CoA/oxaloacetate decarboxylase gamma subunit